MKMVCTEARFKGMFMVVPCQKSCSVLFSTHVPMHNLDRLIKHINILKYHKEEYASDINRVLMTYTVGLKVLLRKVVVSRVLDVK